MRWTWDKFGYPTGSDDPLRSEISRIEEFFANHDLKVIAAARDGNSLLVAVAATALYPNASTINRLCSELNLSHLGLIPWIDDPQQFIRRLLQPAKIDDVVLCDLIGRAIVLVGGDKPPFVGAERDQRLRLAGKLSGWEIEILTRARWEDLSVRAVAAFAQLPHITESLGQRLVEQGFLTFDDLSVIGPVALMEMGNLTAEQVDSIVEQAELRIKDLQ